MTRSKNMFRRTAPLAVAALGLTALAACGSTTGSGSVAANCKPAHQFKTVTKGTLTVATYEFPPHMEISGNKLEGIEGTLLNEVAKKECLTVTPLTAGGAGAAVPAVQTGRADLAAGDWWRTKDRAKVVQLSDPVYLDQGSLVSTTGAKTIADLNGKKIGSVAGNLWNAQFAKVFGKNFTIYQSGDAAFNDLKAGRVDALIDSVAATTARLKKAPIKGVTNVPLKYDPRIPVSKHPGQLNWPTSKQNPGLTKALNADIETMRKDGDIAKALEKYDIPGSLANVGTPNEL